MVAVLYKRLGEGKPVVVSRKSSVVNRRWSIVRRLCLLLAIGLWLTAFSLHPYYMSVTELEYKPAEKEVQVACKIFTDDLEEALKREFNKKVDIVNAAQKKENEQLLQRYLQKHLKLQLDNKAVALDFFGFEEEGEAIWIYLLAKNTAAFKSATVFNDVLYSYREDQLNIIHFKNKGERKSYRLNYPNNQVSFSW
ncbi:hypothetical protein IQ13_3980 [Lacibacter cauensis]|uniref:Uncharacterized protein n=1 Tax=Lacibacter cauensis TaxID=510947 RepID=A0A562SAJ7_9BACT|nr:DUF6702 family protein [Lacibacter cauensis]TWI78298.1 hypothetical protein IQ13_3980 [Lacibacter cauensis]